MKRFVTWAVVGMLTIASTGCQCGPVRGWLCRGYEARCNAPTCAPMCEPACNPCGVGGPVTTYDDGYLVSPQANIHPGPVGP